METAGRNSTCGLMSSWTQATTMCINLSIAGF